MISVPLDRRLVLLRHAKSAYPHGVPDHDRPLLGRGRRNARAAGEWFATEGPAPDLVLCSDAVRAVQTWEIVSARLLTRPETRIEPGLYGAEPDELDQLVRMAPDRATTLLVVGHEPTLSLCALRLAGEGSDPQSAHQIALKFPTNAVAVLRFRGAWRDLRPARAVLETFAVPRAVG